MPEAVGDLKHFLDRPKVLRCKSRRQRHYLVAVCGETVAFWEGGRTHLTWTPICATPNFFIARRTTIRPALDGKIVASIERMGVVIGLVKDHRALIRSIAGLN